MPYGTTPPGGRIVYMVPEMVPPLPRRPAHRSASPLISPDDNPPPSMPHSGSP